MPGVLNVAEVLAVVAEVKETVPGPVTVVHRAVTTPAGNPSSLIDPASVAAEGSVMCCAVPALTTGAAFCCVMTALFTVIVTSALADSCESLAVNRSTYVPA